jgi:hypothetical protein
MAMQGVSWTKTWGAMYLFAFLIVEAAALITRRLPTPSIYLSLPGMRTAPIQVAKRFKSMEEILLGIGLLAHLFILGWAFVDVWLVQFSDYPDVVIEGKHMGWVGAIGTISPFIAFFVFSTLLSSFLRDYHPRDYANRWIPRLDVSLLILAVSLEWYLYGCRLSRFDKPQAWIDVLLFSLIPCGVLTFIWILEKLCSLSPGLGEMLLIAVLEHYLDVDERAVHALIFCIANIVIAVLWYWLRFNPEGTVNPSWTGVFG